MPEGDSQGTPAAMTSGMMPEQDVHRAQILVERWVRDSDAMREWSVKAKECIDFLEGRQWSDEDLAHHDKLGRPIVTINKLNRLVRLVYGYFTSNRSDLSYTPGDDGISTEQMATILSKLYRQETTRNHTDWEDSQIYVDGITTGRGYWDIRQKFDRNDLGETVATALDPFSVYLQHDADAYDIQEHSRVSTSRWTSVDEIAGTYGEAAAEAVLKIVDGDGWRSFPQSMYWGVEEEITPPRTFAGEDDSKSDWWNARMTHLIDEHLKNIRVIDMQYKVRQRARCFVDLETGDWKVIPEFWDDDKIGKVLYHAEKLKNPVKVVNRVVNRWRWTSLVGDIMIWDEWSPYDWCTIVPFFPYFRRGKTRGMLDDLLDPQREINKKRSLRMEILGRTTNGGWSYHENALSPEQEQQLQVYGSTPGFLLKWQGDQPWMEPKRTDHQPRNLEAQSQEQNSNEDILEISGINQSAVGDLDRVQSGKAINARQRQAIVGTRMYDDNYAHSLTLKGETYIKNFQTFYTEERVIREVGESGNIGTMIINQRVMSEDGLSVLSKMNDITLGRYGVSVKQTPAADTFEQAQFEEMLTIFESLGDIGKQVAMANPGLVIEMSTLPRKAEWKEAIQQAIGAKDQEEAKLRMEEYIRSSGATNNPNQVSGDGRVTPMKEAEPSV